MRDKTLVQRIRNRIHDAPMPTEHLLDEAADTIEAQATRIEALEAALRDAAKAERDRLRESPEQISVLVSDRAILLLDISETDGRLSRLCDEIRQALVDALESQP